MQIQFIAGFSVITRDPAASHALYPQALGLPLQAQGDYLFMDGFDGARHFGVWPLAAAAQSCFGTDTWPEHLPVPTATVEFELASVAAVDEAVGELKAKGHAFVHEARLEPWQQTVARFISPEGVLIGLSFAPWMHASEPGPEAAPSQAPNTGSDVAPGGAPDLAPGA